MYLKKTFILDSNLIENNVYLCKKKKKTVVQRKQLQKIGVGIFTHFFLIKLIKLPFLNYYLLYFIVLQYLSFLILMFFVWRGMMETITGHSCTNINKKKLSTLRINYFQDLVSFERIEDVQST